MEDSNEIRPIGELIDPINASYRQFRKSSVEALQAAIDCGQLLLEAKALLRHGHWQQWVANNLEVGERQTQRLIRLAKNRDVVLANATLTSDLTIEGALRVIKTPNAKSTEARENMAMPNLFGDAFAALSKDLEVMHCHEQARKVIDFIMAIREIDIPASAVASQIMDPKSRADITLGLESAFAWLHDFSKALGEENETAMKPSLHLVSTEEEN